MYQTDADLSHTAKVSICRNGKGATLLQTSGIYMYISYEDRLFDCGLISWTRKVLKGGY